MEAFGTYMQLSFFKKRVVIQVQFNTPGKLSAKLQRKRRHLLLKINVLTEVPLFFRFSSPRPSSASSESPSLSRAGSSGSIFKATGVLADFWVLEWMAEWIIVDAKLPSHFTGTAPGLTAPDSSFSFFVKIKLYLKCFDVPSRYK